MSLLNEYNKIADLYNKSHTKPDKFFSILPTVLDIMKNFKNPKVITDLGCGDGYFTFPIAEMFPNAQIIGIDNSTSQINNAHLNLEKFSSKNISFIEKDIFKDEIQKSDIIIAPFIFGYCNKEHLTDFLVNLKNSLNTNGLLVIVLDDPKGIDNSKFGARKNINKEMIDIELYTDGQEKLPTLHAFYHEPLLFLQQLKEIGFTNIKVHTPIISEKGIETYGQDWWHNYQYNSELCYISCSNL